IVTALFLFFFSSRRRHTRCYRNWSSDVCSSDLDVLDAAVANSSAAAQSVNAYGMLAAEKAVEIAGHSHIIEFGLLAILLSFIQRSEERRVGKECKVVDGAYQLTTMK